MCFTPVLFNFSTLLLNLGLALARRWVYFATGLKEDGEITAVSGLLDGINYKV
jgi:hypothetical protein